MQRTFRYRFDPGPQEGRLLAWVDSLRWLYNLAHEQRLMGLRHTTYDLTGERIRTRKYLTAFEQSTGENLTALRALDERLNDTHSKACLAVLHRLDVAWKAWLNPTPAQKARQVAAREARRKKGRPTKDMFRPKFKSKKRGDRVSIMTDQLNGKIPIRRDEQGRWKLKFPNLKPMNVVYHREIVGKPKTMTLSREVTGEWYVAISCELPEPETKKTTPVVGIDRGVTDVIVDSNGRSVPGLKCLDARLKKLRRLQRVVTRRQVRGQPDSARCREAKARVAKLHAEIRRQRDYLLHRESRHYADNAGVVVLEDLNVAGLAKGRLARSVLEQGWSTLQSQLTYKLEAAGGEVVTAAAAYSSQTCHACGKIDADARQGKVYRCTYAECRLYRVPQDADRNAAVVIRQRGMDILAARAAEGPVVQTVTPGRKTGKGRRKGASKSDSPDSAIREDLGPSQVGIAAPNAQGGVFAGVMPATANIAEPPILTLSQETS